MAIARFHSTRFAAGLLLAATLLSMCRGSAQDNAAPAQGDAAASAQIPASVQAQLDKLQATLNAAHAAGDEKTEAQTLNLIGKAYFFMSDFPKALEFYDQALPIQRKTGNRGAEATTLTNLGVVYKNLGEEQKALDYFNQALAIERDANELHSEASTLTNIGTVYDDLGEKQKGLDYYNQGLDLFRKTGNRQGEATALNNIGYVYSDLGQKPKALEYFNQALPILREVGDRITEATTLSNIGIIYWGLGEQEQALRYYNHALEIERALGDRGNAAVTLNNIGDVYSDLGEMQKALEYLNQALPLLHEVGERGPEASALQNIGAIYYGLGQDEKSLQDYNQALSIFKQVGDRLGEAGTLIDIGNIYADGGRRQKGLEYLEQALSVSRDVGYRRGEAMALANIGATQIDLGDRRTALQSLDQALHIQIEIGDRGDEVFSLIELGDLYHELGEAQKELEYYDQALPIATANSDPLSEARIFHGLMRSQKTPHPVLAIFYGKQAVNLLQQVRGNIKGLDNQLQRSFFASKDDYYHDLADLLIAQGRYPEAQQVLDLLKQQEYSDYVRGEAADTLSPLALTPAEQQAEEEYQKSTADIVSLGAQWTELKNMSSRSPEQDEQFKQLSAKVNAASTGLNGFYDRMFVLFGKNTDDNNYKLKDVKGNVSVLERLIAKSPRTVALYTLVTSDHLCVIVITASITVARDFPISEADLNRKVADFEQALRDPARDPRPRARELYNILIAPLKADLEKAHADTLVWSLDGILRYIPMAALYDGKHYLVENYSTATVTPASFPYLAEKPDVSSLSVVAMGISRKYEDNLPALPAVVSELDDVVNDARVQGANGVLKGTILLDGQFTVKAMENELNANPGVVHIASHFVFQPGDDSKSYLLLAGKNDASNGYHMTVSDFRDNRNLMLLETDLLTLSACETGMSGNASNGREVDGLGMTAQDKGAKSVISSLWAVNDTSTGELMGDFYKRWSAGAGRVTKVEALREAQLDLLRGNVKPQAGASDRGFGTVKAEQNVPAGYAHPYYWAPFVLMGNWK